MHYRQRQNDPTPFGGTTTFISTNTSAPLSLVKVVKMNSQKAFVLLGVYINNIDGDVQRPAQFSITCAWAAGKTIEATALQ